jgi:hypothetical protein
MQAKQHIILARNRREAETLRDSWLSENHAIKILRVHRPAREPRVLLSLVGGRDVPRVSITIDYE